MTDTYTVASTLVAALIGGTVAFLGVFLNNRSNTARLRMQLEHESSNKKKELLRGRGEELYELTDKWLNSLAGYYIRRNAVMQGKLSYNQCLDLDLAAGKESTVNFGRIEMLVDVYFPTTRIAYDEIIAARTKLNEIAIAHQHAYDRGNADGTPFFKPFVEAQKAVENAGDKFQADVIACIRGV